MTWLFLKWRKKKQDFYKASEDITFMSKQKLVSGQKTVEGPSHNDRSQREHTLLVSSGFAPGPGSWPRAGTRTRSRRRLGPGVRPSDFFFGVMGWRGGVDLFPRRCRFGAGAGSPSGLSMGPVPVPGKKNSWNHLLITPLYYCFEPTDTLNEIVPVIFAAPASPSSIHPPTGPETNVRVNSVSVLSDQFTGLNEWDKISLSGALWSSAIMVRGRAAGAVPLIAAAAGAPASTVAVVVVVPRRSARRAPFLWLHLTWCFKKTKKKVMTKGWGSGWCH